MGGTITTSTSDSLFVLGETLRPLLTNAMGSAIEIFDTRGPAGRPAAALRTRGKRSTWCSRASSRSIVDGEAQVLSRGGVAHVPAGISTATATSPMPTS